MDIPHRGGRPAAPPEILVHETADRFRMTASRSSSYHSKAHSPTAVSPMSIPNAREYVPPPLPPPTHINNGDYDPGWELQNQGDDIGRWSKPITPGSSLYGSTVSSRSMGYDRTEARRWSSTSTVRSAGDHHSRFDEGYGSLSGTSIGSGRFKYAESPTAQSPRFHVHEKYQSNAHSYDKGMLDKLNTRRGSDITTPPKAHSKPDSGFSASDASPVSRTAAEHRVPAQLKPLSLPILTGRAFVESPLTRWAETPIASAISPSNTFSRYIMQGRYEHQSPGDTVDSDRSPLPYGRRSESISGMNDDRTGVTGRTGKSHDHHISHEHDVDSHGDVGLRRLQINDLPPRQDIYSPSTTAGVKRRASSPLIDDGAPALHTVGSASDLFRRRESVSRSSPSPRFHSVSGSVSSTASGPRNNSYASTLSVTTSISSYGRISPGGASPGDNDTTDAPYASTLPLSSSQQGPLSRPSHQGTLSAGAKALATARRLSDTPVPVKSVGTSKVQGIYMCECCPKKPKKFDSQAELNIHEQEKQYECAYCRNRFKNKNEAERHQNSLHLRRHSWSCAALNGYAAAFHNSPNRPNEADTCGYCGDDFPRSGVSSGCAIATDQDWEVRIGHLQEVHKFGECNHAKKFFRADHFRQHLKHSHAGTSGKWTNMLENACMKDEPLPEPRMPERISPGGSRVARINEEDDEML